jgi:hypothetical protein
MVLVRMSDEEDRELTALANHYRLSRPTLLRTLAREEYRRLTKKGAVA